MRIVKLSVSFVLTLVLIYFLDNRWVIDKTGIPPLGKILDPFGGFWNNIESISHSEPEKLSIPGLKEEVTVLYDSMFIPHIFARNEEDLYLTQGYLTARHRLWQMEFLTYAAAGRVSEFLDIEAAFDYDRKQRRLGMGYGAEHALEMMLKDEKTNMVITKYSEGVNAYINSLSYEDYPVEYKLLHYKPETWTTLKVALMLKNLSQTLNIMENDLQMTNALKLFGKDMLEILYAESDHPIDDPVVYNPGSWKFNLVTLDSVPITLPEEYVTVPLPKETKRGIGSNNWAVHGSRTATGAPILSNDPHLKLSLPSIWFVVHLNAPGVNTMGATFPGAPQVILGWNDSIAWACTNAQRDLVDWYKIKFKDDSYNEYLSDSVWKPTTKRVETFNVRGKGVIYDTVVYTHHGPVVFDKSFHGENEKNLYAFRWIAHDGSNEPKAIYLYNRAKNYTEFTNALEHWWAPAQNFAFASNSGDIAMRVQGKFPVRRRYEGKFILDGTTTNTEWKAFIPQDQNVFYKNPERGFVSSANQYPVDGTYPYYINSNDYESYRNRRINNVLGKLTRVKPQDMMNLQNDNYNLKAAESLPVMISLLNVSELKGEESRVAETLTYWDFVNSKESLAASYYEAWWRNFVALFLDEFKNAEVQLDRPRDYALVRIMKTHPDFPMYDIVSTPEKETLADLLKMSFQLAVKEVNDWENKNQKAVQWADFKDTHIEHLLRLEPFGAHVRIGGDKDMVNAAGKEDGPSWRYVVSLEKPHVKAWAVYPGGQSGNPGSKYYNNLLGSWMNGEYYPMQFHNNMAAIEPAVLFKTNFKPKN